MKPMGLSPRDEEEQCAYQSSKAGAYYGTATWGNMRLRVLMESAVSPGYHWVIEKRQPQLFPTAWLHDIPHLTHASSQQPEKSTVMEMEKRGEYVGTAMWGSNPVHVLMESAVSKGHIWAVQDRRPHLLSSDHLLNIQPAFGQEFHNAYPNDRMREALKLEENKAAILHRRGQQYGTATFKGHHMELLKVSDVVSDKCWVIEEGQAEGFLVPTHALDNIQPAATLRGI
jgi:hypothetical protein